MIRYSTTNRRAPLAVRLLDALAPGHGAGTPPGTEVILLSDRFSQSSLDPHLSLRSFAMRVKGGNHLVPGPNYMVGALKLPERAPRVSGKSLQTCKAWFLPDGTPYLFCWPIRAISGQFLASNGPVFDCRDLNLVFGLTFQSH
ncbi:hypothetical protein TNCV_4497481 [Trichonephila clavipes]|nr:hypothetical protein TNCV_4497481 [Trichonephila clavipes]